MSDNRKDDWPVHPYIFQLLVILALWEIMKAVCVPKSDLQSWRDLVNSAAKASKNDKIIG